MTIKPFKYVPVDSLEAAEALLQEYGERAAVLAGGTDLLGSLKDEIHDEAPEVLIGLKPLAGLKYVTETPEGVRIGALTTLAEIARHPLVQQRYPLLAEAAESVASPQIRNVATIAGNLCQEPRCWYYRNPENTFDCLRKGGRWCDALFAENRYHSIFGGMCVSAAPCTNGCPIHNDIPAYMAELREGKVDEALDILMRTNPLPAITGRACAKFCEWDCNRYAFDEPVSIRDVERYLGDYSLDHASEKYAAPAVETGRQVAVVGAGPAGLTAAYYLRRKGHSVMVFDRMPEAGGMLTYSIPAYRLPKAVVKAQVAALEGMGIRFELGAAVGSDGLTLQDLRGRFDGVFLASGLWTGKKLRLDRSELLTNGLEFLINVQRGVPQTVGQRVLVIGGGSVAVDVAITAKRSGAAQVSMACLESLREMPAIPEDKEQAHEEGITILPSWGPHRVLEQDGKLVGMEFVRCTAVFDEEGRFAPTFDPAVKTIVEADQVLVAIGQAGDLSFGGPELRTERGFVVADKATGATSIPGVFAGGDITGGAATVVQAMATGHRAADAIDAYVVGARAAAEPAPPGTIRLVLNEEALQTTEHYPTPRLSVPERTLWGEDSATVPLEAVDCEPFRCANCGCVAVNASDVATALVALGARVKTTRRTLAAEELFAAAPSRTTMLEGGELIEEIELPEPPARGVQVYHKFRIRNSIDFPIVGVALASGLEGGAFHEPRVVLGAVAPTPLRAQEVEALLEGRAPSAALAEEAGALAVQGAQPLDRNEWKVEVVKALVVKAVLRSAG